MRGGRLESAGGGGSIDEREIAAAVEQRLPSSSLESRVAAHELVASAVKALDKVAGGRSASALSDQEVASLEAIVQVTGRPAMRYPNGRVETPGGLGDNDRWRVFVVTARSKINRASGSVGRITIGRARPPGPHEGTGWRIGDDLVVTNRHVVAPLVVDGSLPPQDWRLNAEKPSFIDFGPTGGPDAADSFEIRELVFCDADPIVDLAVLRVAVAPALPPALPIDWSPGALGRDVAGGGGGGTIFQGTEIYVVGHPFRMTPSSAIAAVFTQADGDKRCSPGVVTGLRTGERVLEHDCSTLGGNSGSCVLTVGEHQVVGLHYGARDVNPVAGTGAANLALALARLSGTRTAQILRAGRV